MTYTGPTTRSTSYVITHTDWNAEVVENFKETLPDKAAAKGDLFVGTGADAFEVLGVGTDGHALVCASAETSGLKWAALPLSTPSYAACYKSSDTSIDNDGSIDIINFDTEVADADGLVTTGASWKFTAAANRIYLVMGSVKITDTAPIANPDGYKLRGQVAIYIDGSLYCVMNRSQITNAIQNNGFITFCEPIYLAASSYFDIRLSVSYASYDASYQAYIDGGTEETRIEVVKLF